jgi:hypothetical protein
MPTNTRNWFLAEVNVSNNLAADENDCPIEAYNNIRTGPFLMHIYKDMTNSISGSSFGRILADSAGDLINLCSFNVTSLAAFVEFYCLRNDYAVYAAVETTLTR